MNDVFKTSESQPLLAAKDVTKVYGQRRGLLGPGSPGVPALKGVSIDVPKGQTVAVIGESGSGKSTLGRILMRLTSPTSGSVTFEGTDLLALKEGELRQLRRRMNFVFQNPYGAVNRRHSIGRVLSAPLVAQKIYDKEGPERIDELLDMVNLPTHFKERFPHELSGGQLQRVVIARALATRPDFVVADEPTTGLDVITSAQIVKLLRDLKAQLGLSLMFISHDLRTVGQVADRIVVMRKGEVVEEGECHEVLTNAQDPYTRKLIASVPRLPENRPA